MKGITIVNNLILLTLEQKSYFAFTLPTILLNFLPFSTTSSSHLIFHYQFSEQYTWEDYSPHFIIHEKHTEKKKIPPMSKRQNETIKNLREIVGIRKKKQATPKWYHYSSLHFRAWNFGVVPLYVYYMCCKNFKNFGALDLELFNFQWASNRFAWPIRFKTNPKPWKDGTMNNKKWWSVTMNNSLLNTW